ncbi:N-acetylmuramate alpha-1-phosphate uridylyltransferase MurU [Tahibacter amnicola]|uniref:Nucleotidyltransferase family protein n=1 Tax=Tahibacter amnicola TaxID=2976241 RepID=A0ABY6BDI6_9GAMM|nr:nucleotidyltransferase family protein [Tahibacter amnicola]UXI67175.1 nucleotidyltransferase family protein [Tahibacter amnicola]
MKALIFAAGRGERMRPLTDHTPKPLLHVGGKPLIVWHLERLAQLGVREVVINTSWLGSQFPAVLGDGARWDLRIHYSHEGTEPLETGGGMLHARHLLGESPFYVVSADIFCDMDLSLLPQSPGGLAHLALVDNPPHHPTGDFALDEAGVVHVDHNTAPRLTYSGIGVFRAALLDDWHTVAAAEPGASAHPPRFKLVTLLRAACARGMVSGQHHRGEWADVGTPQRLRELDDALRGISR